MPPKPISAEAILSVKPDSSLSTILLPVLDLIDQKKSEGVHMSTIARELGIDPVVFRYAYRRAKAIREKKQDDRPSKKANQEDMLPSSPERTETKKRKTRKPKPAAPPVLQSAI